MIVFETWNISEYSGDVWNMEYSKKQQLQQKYRKFWNRNIKKKSETITKFLSMEYSMEYSKKVSQRLGA